MSGRGPVTAGRALVLDGHSAAAVEALQSLGRAGVQVHVAAEREDCLAFVSRYPRQRLRQPPALDKEAFLRWLSELDAQWNYGLVVAATENSLVALNALPEGSPLRAKALLPAARDVETALSKQATWELGERLGVPTPRSRLIETLADAEDPPEAYPLVLKPVRSVVADGNRLTRLSAVIVRDAVERQAALERLLPLSAVQEQSYVVGRGLGVECLYSHGRMVWCFVHERLHELPLTGGGSSYRRSAPPIAAAIHAARRLLDELRWHGVAMVEFKRAADGKLCLMEINPRLWGSLALAIDAGVDFPLGMWRLAHGESPGPQPVYRVPYYTRHLAMDVDWIKENLRAPRSDPLLLTQPRLRSLIEYARPALFVESWDHFDIRDIGVVARQVRSVVRENLRALKGRLSRALVLRELRRRHARLLRRLEAGKARIRSVLFVCYGNICRSAFAEVYARRKLSGVEVTSAGFHEKEGRPSPEHLVRVARQLGVPMSDWRSRRLDDAMVERADLILVMDEANYRMLLRRYPGAAGRVTALGLFAGKPRFPLEDPYVLDDEATREVLLAIRDAVDGLESRLGRFLSDGHQQRAAS